jgi:hypothetical protein
MAATEKAQSFRNATLELNTNMTTPAWTSIDSTFVEIATSGGEWAHEDTHVAGSHFPLVTYGKKSSTTLTITLVYTEDAAEGAALFKAVEGDMAQVRWTIAGGAVGDTRWTSQPGVVTRVSDPVGSVGAPGSVKTTVTMQTPHVDDAVIAA